jgi:ribosome-binding protein aMBF1 (putative translation factor)
MVRRVDWDRLRVSGDKKEYTLDDVRRSLAAKMVRHRQAAGLTQSELARRAKVRVETISRLENAQHMPSVRTFDRINHVLNVK